MLKKAYPINTPSALLRLQLCLLMHLFRCTPLASLGAPSIWSIYKIGHGIALVLGLFLSTQAPLWALDLSAEFKKRPGPSLVSAQFVRVSDGKELFSLDEDKLLSPASVTKILVAATVLHTYGPAAQFKTPVYFTGKRVGSSIAGDLIFVGIGDPFLTSEKLWQMAADFRNLGIKEVKGDIVIDQSLFDGDERDLSRQDGARSSGFAYDAPISAFGVNFNTLAVLVAPANSGGSGGQAYAALDPYPIRGVQLDAKIKTVGGDKKNLQIERNGMSAKNISIRARGSIGADAELTRVYRSLSEASHFAAEQVRAFLAKEGVRILGKVRIEKKPANAQKIYDIEGYPVAHLVGGLNKFSNNFIADVLLKKMGAEFSEKNGAGTFSKGLEVVKRFVRELGVKGDLILENGSGLALENRLSAEQINRVLLGMERHFDLFPDFLASLPQAGLEGTMKKRFKPKDSVEDVAIVRAKTGTLSEPISVASLAGYYRSRSEGLVAFTIIENGIAGKPQPSITALREHQDQVLDAALHAN